MKRFINGEEHEFATGIAKVDRLGDKLRVSTKEGSATAVCIKQGDVVHLSYRGRQYKIESKQARGKTGGAASGEIRAPMPGLIVDVRVEVGQVVKKGDTLVVLEAMKTQQPFTAPFDGTVDDLWVSVGLQVGDGDLLALVKSK